MTYGDIFCASGYRVSSTVRKGILQVELYEGAELELMLGMFAALSEYLVAVRQRHRKVHSERL
jgi:hypothetical protein